MKSYYFSPCSLLRLPVVLVIPTKIGFARLAINYSNAGVLTAQQAEIQLKGIESLGRLYFFREGSLSCLSTVEPL